MEQESKKSPLFNALVLEYIEVENFKSYAHKHRIGPFDDTFTAVIGPNGSGKSNILDALLFVFGKRATKIRLDRLAELIHSSAACPSFSHASVTVIFRETGSDKRIHLSRVVYRHNSSTQYFIDEKKHTHTSVVNFLKEKGVDLEHNRFLILQGEVEQIALMRPKAEREGEEGFLEYLDDLIGTNRYVSAISELATKTEALQEDRMTVLERTHKLGKDRDLLESGKNAAVSYVKKDNQMQKIVSTMCQMKIQTMEEELAPQRAAVRSVESTLNELQRATTKAQSAVEDHEKEIGDIDGLLTQAEAEHEKLVADKDTYERQIQEIKSHIEHAEKEEKKHIDNQKKLKDEILKIKNQLEDVDRDKQIAQENRKEVEARQERTEPELERMTESLQTEMKPLQSEREKVLRTLAPFKSQIDERTKKIDTLAQREKALQRDVERRQEAHERLLEEQATLKEKLPHLRAELQRLEDDLSQLSQTPADSLQALERKREDTRQKKVSLSQQIDSIKRQMQSSLGDDKVTQFLESQAMSGYYGPLRKLCSIDDRYDIAAGVAGGAFWSYHVVENETVAQNCISKLKQHDVGRGSFIVLSFQQKAFAEKVRQNFHAPEQTIRVFDQLRFVDKKFSCAGYFAVRDTLVAESLQVARKVGLDRRMHFRTVTCNGELVEPSGQMTGGGQRRPQGARLQGSMNVASGHNIRDELNMLTAELEKVSLEERDVIARLSNRRENDTKRNEARRDAQMQYQQTKATMQKQEASLAQTNAEIEEQCKGMAQAKAHLDSKEFRGIREDVERLVQEQEAIKIQSQELTAKLCELEGRLEAVGGPAYKDLQATVENDRKWLSEQETKTHQLKKVDARLKSQLQSKLTELKEYDTNRKENKSAAEKLANLRRSLEDVHQLVAEVTGVTQKKRKVIVEAQETKRKITEKIYAMNTEIRSLQEKQQDTTARIKELSDEIDEKRQGVAKYEEGIETCEGKVYENLVEFGEEVIAFKDAGDTLSSEDYIAKHTNREAKRFNTRVSPEVLAGQDFKQLKYLAEQLKAEIDRVREQIDLASVRRWKEKDTLWKEEKQKYDGIHEETVKAEEDLALAREQRQNEFREAFGNIRLRLKSLYQILTQGGDADLEYVDEHDPFQGINFCVRPPKKSWKHIGQLSGGEKTLASLSFIFALHHYRPTPIYIMDEIDAALDFRNVSIVAQYVSTQAIQAQFIIISLRNSMFEMANQLIGVSKVKDCTTSIALAPVMIKTTVESRCHGGKSVGQVMEGC